MTSSVLKKRTLTLRDDPAFAAGLQTARADDEAWRRDKTSLVGKAESLAAEAAMSLSRGLSWSETVRQLPSGDAGELALGMLLCSSGAPGGAVLAALDPLRPLLCETVLRFAALGADDLRHFLHTCSSSVLTAVAVRRLEALGEITASESSVRLAS